MDLDKLRAALQSSKRIQDHPDWEHFKRRTLPQSISFYYTNQDGQEAYWDHAKILKIDLPKLLLIVEGSHGDPLRFDIIKLQHCKNAKTGEKVQDLFFDLIRMWQETYTPNV